MSKYDRLGDYLKQRGTAFVPMNFAEIENVLGFKLPASQKHQAWWSNSTSNNVMTQVWLDAGYRTEQVDVDHKRLVFRRAGDQPEERGMSETAQQFRENEAGEKKPGRHPLIGSMKGTFTIEPGYDLTSPMYSSEEWAEVEKEMNADWDQIEEGMKRKP